MLAEIPDNEKFDLTIDLAREIGKIGHSTLFTRGTSELSHQNKNYIQAKLIRKAKKKLGDEGVYQNDNSRN